MAAPSKKRQKTCGRDVIIPVCMFCGRPASSDYLYGEFLENKKQNVAVHQSCLMFSSVFKPKRSKIRLSDKLIRIIRQDVARAAKITCTVCNNSGASISCSQNTCKACVHYPCGQDTEYIFQHFKTYNAYCPEHHPGQQTLSSEEETPCCICLDSMTPSPRYGIIRAPCCKGNWFHRTCLQSQALNAGRSQFRCPVCNNKTKFCREILRLGIYIPDRAPSWELETSRLVVEQLRCDITPCVCDLGRGYNEPGSDWAIILCPSCESFGSHARCSALTQEQWKCGYCAFVPNTEAGEGPSQSPPLPSTSAEGNLSNSPRRRRRSPDSDEDQEPPVKIQKLEQQ